MMKALYSGVSGLKSHQTKMDVIGNNISNVNTYGFKAQRATFRDVYYQTIKTPGSPGADDASRGGTNASQVGYGAQVGSIDTIHSMSGYAPTDKSTDLCINGEGYLAVRDASNNIFYTRLGSLNFDSAGNLVDTNGSKVMGLNSAGTGSIEDITGLENIQIANFENYKNITINSDGSITGTDKATSEIKVLATIYVANIPNQDALVLAGNSYYVAGNNTGDIDYEVPGVKGTGALITGGLEMSNVDLAKEFSDMIITQRGFQANTKIVSVVDQMLEELVNLKR